MALPKDPLDHADQVAAKCSVVSARLAQKGHRVQFWLQILRIASTLIGITAMICTLSPLVAKSFPNANAIIAIVSSVTLVVASTLYIVIGHNPPERYADYSRYIESYARRIDEIAANDSLEESIKKMQLQEIVHLANLNLTDVKAQWPWVAAYEGKS